jgi:ABC-type sugar transport system substrate-binding protein
VIAVITNGYGAWANLVLATASDVAGRDGFAVRSLVPRAATVAEQARLLGVAISARVRAIVLDPISYSALLPYLRAAHDAEIPVVLMQTPRDLPNPTFVASFVTPKQNDLDVETANELGRLTRADGEVALIAARPVTRTARASIAGLRKALGKVRSGLQLIPADIDVNSQSVARTQLRRVFISHPHLTAVVVADELVANNLRLPLTELNGRRPTTIVTIVNSTALDLLSLSLVDAVIGADTCVMTRAATTNAVAAAERELGAINPSAVVPVQTISRRTLNLPCSP